MASPHDPFRDGKPPDECVLDEAEQTSVAATRRWMKIVGVVGFASMISTAAIVVRDASGLAAFAVFAAWWFLPALLTLAAGTALDRLSSPHQQYRALMRSLLVLRIVYGFKGAVVLLVLGSLAAAFVYGCAA